MLQVSRLDCANVDPTLQSCDPSASTPVEAKNWRDTLGNASVNSLVFAERWTQGLKAVLCAREDGGLSYAAGGRSWRSLGDDTTQNSLFALREMTSVFNNQILPAVTEIREIDKSVPDLVDFMMSKDCPVSALLTDADKARLLRIQRQALQAAGNVLAPVTGAVDDSLPRFPQGTPYVEARQSLQDLGYRPELLANADPESRVRCGFKVVGPTEPKPSAGEADDMRCFPEMVTCAGIGPRQCSYSWRRGETLIDVLTVNEVPMVSGVKCRVNCSR
jgi:hypothetical protein